jgi:glycosyltransferase involved in cell wall biosynthesis
MFILECELSDSLMRPVSRPPVLSVVIITWNRPKEVTEAVVSIADQIDASLAGKVEIIVTDNASGPETAAALKQLADTYPSVNYMIHARNEGGQLQIYSAPARARGRWTWVFGDDDALAEGTLAPIVQLLEREEPAFLTLNRQVWNPDMDTLLQASKHGLPDTGFNSLLDFLALFGFDQLSFLTSQVYLSDVALTVDPAPYIEANSRYGQLAYYLEAFHDRSAYYSSLPSVRHRWDPNASDVHAANFLHLATTFPDILQVAADKAGLEPGLFERIGGRRRLSETTKPLTFVDNILENLWRCLAVGVPVEQDHWNRLDQLSSQWRADHAAQLKTVREIHTSVGAALSHYHALVAEFRQRADAGPHTQEDVDMLQQLAAAAKSLGANIEEARKTAYGMAGQLNG